MRADADIPILEQLTISQAKYVTARFLQRFDAIESANKSYTMSHQTEISTRFVFDSRMRFHCANH